MNKKELILRLEDLIEELKAEPPKPERGWILEWSNGDVRSYYGRDGWSERLQEAHMFKERKHAVDAISQAQHVLGHSYFITKVVRDRNGRIRRLK